MRNSKGILQLNSLRILITSIIYFIMEAHKKKEFIAFASNTKGRDIHFNHCKALALKTNKSCNL